MVQKMSANQLRRIEELQQFVRTVDHVRKLIAELESNRAARPVILNGICSSISRELSQMRQRAMTANVGTLPDVAGNLAVIASRQGTGMNMKLRALQDGMNSMAMQLDQSLKSAHEAPPEKEKEPPRPQ
jgi:hypothetical protein